MKKLMFLFLTTVAVTACSEDIHQEIDEQTIGENGTLNGNPTDGSGNTTYTFDPATAYQSPYDNNICCTPVAYSFENLTTDLDLEFVPYVGLARYDGAYDTKHFAWAINSTLYPNLLLQNEDEYFRLIECNPFFIGAGNADNFAYSVQLPIGTGNKFSITPPSTPSESSLLLEYGKIYAIDAVIKDPSGNVVASERLRFPFLPSGVNRPPVTSGFVQMPTLGKPEQNDLWYHIQTKEICVGSDPAFHHIGGDGLSGRPSELNFVYNGTLYNLSLTTDLSTVRITLQ